jgi:hypothetical protein
MLMHMDPLPEERWNSNNWLDRLKAWWLGFKEAGGDLGVTWDDDQGLSEAYDKGRYFGQRLRRIK